MPPLKYESTVGRSLVSPTCEFRNTERQRSKRRGSAVK
jgi:hypothetical protein